MVVKVTALIVIHKATIVVIIKDIMQSTHVLVILVIMEWDVPCLHAQMNAIIMVCVLIIMFAVVIEVTKGNFVILIVDVIVMELVRIQQIVAFVIRALHSYQASVD